MMVRLIEGDHAEVTLNMGNQEAECSIGDVARTVLEVVGKELTIEPQPATPGSPARRCPDMSRMTELTGYTAKVGLKEGVERTYDWYRREVFDAEDGVTAT
jgi:nucleoside-diphosphate-sugar epimerase